MIVPQIAKKRALFIIDVQTDTLKNDSALAIVDKIAAFLEKIDYDAYVVVEYSAPKSSMFYKQCGFELTKEEAGGTDCRIESFLQSCDANVLHVEKTGRSCFKGNHPESLTDFLGQYGIEEAHFVGFDINDCVLASAYDALDLGYYSFVLEELCHHHAGLDDLRETALKIFHRQEMTNNSLAKHIPYEEVEVDS